GRLLMQLWIHYNAGKNIKVTWAQVNWRAGIMLHILKPSLGGIGQMLVNMTSWIFLMRILADVGSAAVEGATITIRIMMMTMMPAWGLSNAAATLVGQNPGAGNPERAQSAVWRTGFDK